MHKFHKYIKFTYNSFLILLNIHYIPSFNFTTTTNKKLSPFLQKLLTYNNFNIYIELINGISIDILKYKYVI